MMRSEYPSNPQTPLPKSGSQSGDPLKYGIVAELLKEPGNEKCADCNAPITMENTWAILSYGILVCDDCKLVHIEHENHYTVSDGNGTQSESSTKGILSTQSSHIWEDKDIAQIRANGNKRSNAKFLKTSPIWQYCPSPKDGIKLKEYWIKCKYSGNVGEAAENQKMGAKKSFIGIQFARPRPKGSYPCCAVLQNDTLYLTSDTKNEEVPVESIETLVINSQRIGHENGVQLTYRIHTPKDGHTAAFTYLQHDNIETVMDFVNLVLYTKYNLLKRKYPTMIDQNIAKILNCGIVKESYTYISGKGLVYLSLSEARLSCFNHHLDDRPLFQIPVSELMNLNVEQYLEAVACYFDIDQSKVQSRNEWLDALNFVLTTDKIAAMPEDVPRPTFPFSLLKRPEKIPAVEKTEPVQVKENPPAVSAAAPPITTAAPVKNTPTTAVESEKEAKPSNYECYPPIGPMGEMGKVFRGELPPDAIKPPPSKSDITRLGMYGDYIPQITTPVQLPIKTASYSELSLLNPALTSYSATLNHAHTGLINQTVPKEGGNCYPPIGGPPQARKLQCDINTLTALQAAQLRREPEAHGMGIDDFRNGAATVLSTPFMRTLAQKQLLDQARLPGLTSVGRYTDADALATSGLAQPHFQGWSDPSADSILTVPWKNTVNGFEPTRGYSGATSSYNDLWNASKMPVLANDRNKLAQQQAKMDNFGTWGVRPPSSQLAQQQVSLGRSNSGWGSTSMSTGGIDQWSNRSPTSPIDSFSLSNSRDNRVPASGMFGATNGGRNIMLSGKVGASRSDIPASGIQAKQQLIVENLLHQWKSAEQKLLSLIHNGYVPASDMSPAGLEKDSAEHAYTCVSELFDLLWKQRYDLALSFLRGFREVFANSVHPEIRNLFIGVGELDTMKQIFIQQGKEKFLSATAGGPVNWKQPTPPPAQAQFDSAWPSSSGTLPVRQSPTDFSPWGNYPSQTADSPWGITNPSVGLSMKSPSDPWGNNSVFSSSAGGLSEPTFNRAPSRPSQSQSTSNQSDHSPTDGSYGSKASSDSTSPQVVTPPTSYEPLMNPASLTGLESTLKNIFLNSSE